MGKLSAMALQDKNDILRYGPGATVVVRPFELALCYIWRCPVTSRASVGTQEFLPVSCFCAPDDTSSR